MLIVTKLVFAGGVAAMAMAGPTTLGGSGGANDAAATAPSALTALQEGAIPTVGTPGCQDGCNVWQLVTLGR